MKLTDRSFAELLQALRSPAPTPGGGSAAAAAGAMGAALLAMVADLPKHRAGSEEDVERLRAAGARCADLSGRLLDLVDLDSVAYEAVVAAYKLPKATPDEQTGRSSRIQQALHGAADVPLEVMHRCADAIEAAAVIAAFGAPMARSDSEVGVELVSAGARGAGANVEINLASIRDEQYVADARRRAGTLLLEIERGAAAARRRLADPAAG